MERLTNTQPWTAQARCAETDPEVFFPPDRFGTITAKRICRGCPVQQACAAYALAHPSLVGVWGGTTTEERQRIRAGRAREDNTRLARTRAAMRKEAR